MTSGTLNMCENMDFVPSGTLKRVTSETLDFCDLDTLNLCIK